MKANPEYRLTAKGRAKMRKGVVERGGFVFIPLADMMEWSAVQAIARFLRWAVG